MSRNIESNSIEDQLDSKKKQEVDVSKEIVEPENTDPQQEHNPEDSREKNPEKVPEKVKELNVTKESGYLYFIDKDGDLSRVPAKWNQDPRFLEKVKEDELAVERKIEQLQEHYPKKQSSHHDPIPVTHPDIPKFLINKDIVYVDKAVVGVVNDSAVSKAHTKIYSITPYDDTKQKEFVHLATVSSFCASILFESLQAQGTNIILTSEDSMHSISSIIPRFENDGLGLMWDIKQGDQNEIQAVADKIKAAFVIGPKTDFNKINLDEPKTQKKVNIIDTKEVEKEEKKINHMIDHLSNRWA